ncbi:hypothetical protein EJ06DRAFT_427386 [Trichodelitschia bisporula]|uniref:Uncharacterized protein n=1 Tax=Trichodelitschia bisporula TaxID=703511 RepID=A0A6G1HWC7_9PEZI|nr:hypothetical protein EJ06DRAFT_427386 [Trichodelitschia bisporula]
MTSYQMPKAEGFHKVQYSTVCHPILPDISPPEYHSRIPLPNTTPEYHSRPRREHVTRASTHPPPNLKSPFPTYFPSIPHPPQSSPEANNGTISPEPTPKLTPRPKSRQSAPQPDAALRSPTPHLEAQRHSLIACR